MANNTNILGQDPIEKEDLSKTTTTDQGTPIDAYTQAANMPSPAYAAGLGRQTSYITPDQPLSQFKKRVGEYIPTGGRDLAEELAQNQSAGERWAYFLPRAATKAAASAASLPGYISGFAQWADSGFDPEMYGAAFNNGWIAAVDNAEQKIKDLVPVYTPKSVIEGGLWKNLGSSAFWANEGADGVGFLVGMLAPGMLTKALNVGEKVQGLFKAIKPGYNLSEKLAGAIDDWTAVTLNTGFEAATEGRDAYQSAMDQYGDPELAGRAGANTFKANLAILAGPNILTQKWLFNGFNRGKSKAAESILARSFDENGAVREAVKPLTKAEKVLKIGKTVGTGILSEGFFEEGFQNVVSDMSQEGNVPLANIDDVITEYIDHVIGSDKKSVDFWKSVVLGGLMGGGMASVEAVRENKNEEKLTNEYHSLLKSNYLNRYATLKDFAVKKDGEAVVDPVTGEYVIDKENLSKAAKDNLQEYQMTQFMALLKDAGEEEAFEYYKNMLDARYIYPYIQAEGGLDLFKKHAEYLAKKEAAQDAEATGIDPGLAEQIKTDLIKKAERLQAIYDNVKDQNAITLRNSIKRNKADNDIFNEFVNETSNAKISTKNTIEFVLDRLDGLRSKLAEGKAKVTSSETKVNDKLVSSLKQSLEESKKVNNLDQQDILNAERQIDEIENYVEDYKTKSDELKDLYNTANLQKAYDKKVADKIKAKQLEDQQNSQTQANRETEGLSPELTKIYNDNVKHETLSLVREPDLTTEDLLSKKNTVTHRGVIAIPTAEGEIYAKVGTRRSDGSLSLQLMNKVGDKYEETRNRAYLNPNGTVTVGKDNFATSLKNIKTVRTAEQVREDSQIEAITNQYTNLIDIATSIINGQRQKSAKLQERLNRISSNINTVVTKYQDTLTAEEIELRKIRVGSRVEEVKTKRKRAAEQIIKRTVPIYKTIAEARTEISQIEAEINNIEQFIVREEAKIASLRQGLEKAQSLDVTVLNSLNATYFRIRDEIQKSKSDISDIRNNIASLRGTLRKLLFNLKSIHADLIEAFNIPIDRDIPTTSKNSFKLETNGKIYEYSRSGGNHLFKEESEESFHPISESQYNNAYDTYYTQMEEIGLDAEGDLILKYLEEHSLALEDLTNQAVTYSYNTDTLSDLLTDRRNILDKISAINDIIADETNNFNNRKASLANLTKSIKDLRNFRNNFLKEYKSVIGDFFTVDDWKESRLYDESLDKESVLEGKFGTLLRMENGDIIYKFEEGPLKVFDGTVNSFLIPGTDQSAAPTNDQVAYWFSFVNNFAYEEGFKKYSIIAVSQSAARGLAWGDKLKFIDADDIKYVAVKRGTFDPVLMDESGNVSETGTHMAVTSMILPKFEYTKLIDGQTKDRFSYVKLSAKFKKDNPQATEEEIQKYLDKEKDRVLAEYKALREEIKGSNSPKEFTIEYVTAGKKITKNVDDIDALEGIAINNMAENASFVIENAKPIKDTGEPTDETTKHKSSNNSFDLVNGFLYIRYKNRFELIKPKTLGETNDVENILNLFKFVAKNLNQTKDGKLTAEAEQADLVRQYLTKVLYHNAAPASGYHNEFRLFFRKNDKGVYTGLAFGETPVSMEDLANGKADESLKFFLSNKYWNFNKKLIDNRDTKFIEFRSRVDSKGIIHINEKNHRNYLHFLFPNNVPVQKGITPSSKGLVALKPAPKDRTNNLALAKDPQYINQGLQLSIKTEDKPAKTQVSAVKLDPDHSLVEVIYNDNSGNPVTKYMFLDKKINKFYLAEQSHLDGILAPLKLTKDDLVDATMWTASLRAILRADDGTARVKEDSTVNNYTFKFHSGEFSPVGDTVKVEEEAPQTAEDLFNLAVKKAANRTAQPVAVEWGDLSPEIREKWENDARGYTSEEDVQSEARKNYERTRSSDITELEKRVDLYGSYEKENIAAAKRWLHKKFPGFPVEVINGIIENKAWGKILSSGKILISDMAVAGTAYHEGWHAYSQFFITKEERDSIYKETRERLGNDKLSDLEIEEVLAEEFRDFMMMGPTYKFNKITEIQKESIFRKILNFIKQLFGITTEDIDRPLVDKAFTELRDSTFTEMVSEPKDSFFKVANLSPSATQAFVEDINSKFLNYVFKGLEAGEDSIMNLDQKAKRIYSILKLKYETDSESGDNIAKTIVTNWDELIKKHAIFMTQYKADFRSQLDEDELVGRNRNDFLEASSVNVKDEVPSPIRLLIGSLAETRMESGQAVIERKEGFGTEVRVKFNKLMTAINNIAAGSADVNDFYTKLLKLVPQYPAVRRLIRILGNNVKDGVVTVNESISKTQFDLRNQMYHSFANNKTVPIIGIIGDTGIDYVYPSDENEVKVLKTDWINNALELAKNNKSKYINSDNQINKSLLISDITAALREKNTVALKKVFEQLGIIVEPKYNNTYDNIHVTYASRLKTELQRSDLGDIVISDLYNGDRIENQKEMDIIIRDAIKDYINDSDLTHQTINKNLEYGVSRGSHFHEVSDRINSFIESDSDVVPRHLKHIVPLNENGEGNLFTMNSLFYQAVLEAKRNFKAGNSYKTIKMIKLLGVKDRKDNGRDLKEETHFDYLMMTTDAILNNIIPLLRAGDRGPEYGIDFLSNEDAITRESFINKMKGYLHDEIITTIALLKAPDKFGGNYEHYKNNAKELRTFSFIEKNIASVADFVANKRGRSLNSIKQYTQEYLDTYTNEITKELSDYIDEMMSNNLQEFKEWKLINNIGNGKYKIQGISFKTLKSIGISMAADKTVDDTAINQILMRHAHNYFIGSQEQVKMYLGDIAFFKDAKDFHKRITSHTSTRTKLPNDQATIDLANTHYPQIFNQHKTDINGIVWDKISLRSKAYGGRSMDVADGQLWSTLEFARTIKVRQGLWTDEMEAAYQYENQWLLLETLKEGNEDLLKALGKTREDVENMFKEGILAQHTRNTIPEAPMFKGRKITAKDMATITTIKPLGVGAEQNAGNLFAPSIQKCSVAPIIPSILPRNSLKIYLSALANNVDTFGDTTVQKETYISSGKFGVIDENSPINVTLFDDFGIQSDMNTEDKERITKSTQLNRVLFVETHNKGQITKKYKDTNVKNLIEEHKAIISALTKNQMDRLKDRLGLSINKDGQYYLDDTEAFKDTLVDMVQSRLMPDSVADGIIQAIDSKSKSIDILITRDQVESMLMALPKKKAIAFKVNGEMYAQESSWIYSEDGSPALDFGYPEGNPMEVMLPIPEKWVTNGFIDSIGGVDALNKMIEEGKVDERILKITANRIPTAAPNTLEAIKIKKFLPYHAGPRIILPYDIVIKTSSDFDIDKLFTYLNNVKIKEGKLEYIPYLDDNNSTVEERYEAYYNKEDIKEDELADQVLGLFGKTDTKERKTKTLAEFSKLPIVEQNTRKAIENRYNEISFESLLMPERKETLLKPHESTTLKKIAEDIAEKRSKTELDRKEESVVNNRQYLTEYWYNARKYKEFQASKSLVAFVAAASSVNNKAQENPVRIDNPILNLFFSGMEKKPGEIYTNGNLVDTNGYPIYDNYGQFLVAAVDAVKDPYIFSLLPDNSVYSIYSFLNKNGIDKGVGIRTIAKLLTSPIIKEYLKELNIASSLGYNNSPYAKVDLKKRYNEKALIIEDLIKKYSNGKVKNIDKDMLYTTFDKYVFSSDPDAKANLEREYNEKLEKLKYKYLTEEDMSKPENYVQMLDNFLMYQRAAFEEIRLQKYMRFDASGAFPKSITSVENRLEDYAELHSNIFDISDIYKYTQGSYLNAFLDTYHESGRMYRWSSYILSNPARRALFQRIAAGVLNNPKNPSYNMRRDVKSTEKALLKVENDLYQYIYMTMKYNGDVDLQRRVYERLLTGKDSIPKRFNALKKRGLLDKTVVKILRPVINEYSNTIGKTRQNDYITTFTKKHDLTEENDLTNSIASMLQSSNEEIRKFANGLFELGLIQSGLTGSPISYARYLPSSKYVAEMDNYIIGFFNKPNVEELMLGFANQFGKVNNSDTNFVPRHHKFAERLSDGRIKLSGQNEQPDGTIKMYLSRTVGARYVNVRLETPYQVYKEKTNKGRKAPIENVLFEFVKMADLDPTFKLPMAIYRRVSKAGDSFRFLEYYTQSISPGEFYNTKGPFPGTYTSILDDNQLKESKSDTSVKESNDLDDINAAFSAAREQYQLLNNEISEENITDLDNKMKDFFDKAGVTFEETKVLTKKFGDNTVAAVADLVNMTVKVLEGKMNRETLPEEAAHFYVHLLNKDTGLYKAMMTNIVNHPIYSEVKDKYKDIYNTEEEFRTEAIGQVIAKEIVKQYTANERLEKQATTWLNVLWNWIKNFFNKRVSDPYAKAAYDVLNNKIDNLLVEKPMVEQDEIANNLEQVENKEDNFEELKKETDNLDMSNLIANFDEIFPEESWRNTEEKRALMEATLGGQLEIVCGL